MTERSRNIMVGLTTVGCLLAMALLMLLIGYLPKIFEPGYTVSAQLMSSQGVNDSSRVWLYGIDVGKVESVSLLTFPKKGVMLKIRVREGIKLPAGTRVNINSPLLGGSPTLSLDTTNAKLPQGDEAVEYLPTDGSAMLAANTQQASLESRLGQEFRTAMESASAKLTAKIEGLSKEWMEVGQNINQLVGPRRPEDVDNGKVAGNLSSAVARIDSRVKELAESLDALNKWASDAKLHEDVSVTVANARKLTQKMDTSLDIFNKAATSADKNIDMLATRFVASADDLSATITSMQKTLDALRDGKGTTGKLINDPAVYNNLNDAVLRIGKAADEFKIMMEKWRKEGLPLKL